MLVKKNGENTAVEVYGIYWNDGERIYFIMPHEGYEVLITLSENESVVIDPKIRNFVLRKNEANEDFFLHWAAEKDNLIDDLIDHDPEAMKEFKRRLAEGF